MSQPIIKRERIQVSTQAVRPESSETRLLQTHEARAHGQKAVRLLEEGGRVRAIEFTCSCGEVTCVELAYPGEGADA